MNEILEYCSLAQNIILRDGNLIVKNGQCSQLYYHLASCIVCRKLREAKTK